MYRHHLILIQCTCTCTCNKRLSKDVTCTNKYSTCTCRCVHVNVHVQYYSSVVQFWVLLISYNRLIEEIVSNTSHEKPIQCPPHPTNVMEITFPDVATSNKVCVHVWCGLIAF